MAKGQLEFIAIIGIVIIAIIAIYYLFLAAPAFPVSPAIPEHLKHVHSQILSIIKERLTENLEIIEAQGGLFSPPADSPLYIDTPVAYWSACGNKTYPTLQEIENNLKNKTMGDVLASLNNTMTIDGKQVSFDKTDVKAEIKIEEDKINFALWLPTKVGGEELEQPYVVTVPTRFGYIYKFAKDFTNFQANTRALEWATIKNLYYSQLPTFGWLTECGQTILLMPEETSALMRGVFEYTLSNIQWWKPVNTKHSPVLNIPDLDGKKYTDLNPQLGLPLLYATQSGMIFIGPAEPILRLSGIFSYTVQICIQWYNIRYSFRYPAIVSVYDELADNFFKFAINVAVDNMRPANDCAATLTPAISCENPTNPINITVIDQSGAPIPGATVYYEGCAFTTDANGNVKGAVTASIGNLTVSAPGYSIYRERKSVSELVGLTVVLLKPSKIKFSFYKDTGSCHDAYAPVDVEAVTLIFNSTDGSRQYYVMNYNLSKIIDCNNLSELDCIKQTGDALIIKHSVTVDYIPPGLYNVYARVMSKEGLQTAGAEIFTYEGKTMGKYQHRATPIETSSTQINIPPYDANLIVTVPDMKNIMDMADDVRDSAKDDCCEDMGGCDSESDHDKCRGVAIGEAIDWLLGCGTKSIAVLQVSDRCSENSAQNGILKQCQNEFRACGGFYKNTPPGCIPGSTTNPCDPCNATCMVYMGCYDEINNFAILNDCVYGKSTLIPFCIQESYKAAIFPNLPWKPTYNLPPECLKIMACFDYKQIALCSLQIC